MQIIRGVKNVRRERESLRDREKQRKRDDKNRNDRKKNQFSNLDISHLCIVCYVNLKLLKLNLYFSIIITIALLFNCSPL